MVLKLESCSLEESCAALGGTPKLLFELRDRLRDWLKLQPHLPQDYCGTLSYQSLKMVLILESCSYEESCAALGGTPKLLFELRDRLRDWLKLQPHLPQDVPDHRLEYLLLGTKLSLEQAKSKLDMMYTLKRHAPELLLDRDPRNPSFDLLHKMVQLAYIPKLTPEKCTVAIVRPIADDYRKFNAADSMKFLYMMGDIQAAEARTLGSILIMDQSKATLSYIAAFSPMLIKKCEASSTKSYAVRIKGIHFVNASAITNQLITLAKTVLKPKLAARIHVHPPGNYESLHKFVSKSVLPKDYGGDEMSMDELCAEWRKKVDDRRDWFLEQDKLLTDERLRPGTVVDADELFGISGSFRKLDVD